MFAKEVSSVTLGISEGAYMFTDFVRKAQVANPPWDCRCCINEEDHRRKNSPYRETTAIVRELQGLIILLLFLVSGRFAFSQVVDWAGWIAQRVGDPFE